MDSTAVGFCEGPDPTLCVQCLLHGYAIQVCWGEDVSIHCYEVQWDPSKLSWESFRGELLGPTDPKECPEGSIRKAILDSYKELGLTSVPNKGDNGVHASASPFEGLAEKW